LTLFGQDDNKYLKRFLSYNVLLLINLKTIIIMLNQNSKKTIRFGIMCESLLFKSWEAECIYQLLNMKDIRPVLIINPEKRSSFKKKDITKNLSLKINYSHILYDIYENKIFKNKIFSHIDFSEKFKEIKSIKCNTELKNGKVYFSREDVEKIKRSNLDFIILFSGFRNIEGEILHSTKYGVWLYNFCGSLDSSGILPCFWAIYNNEECMEISLLKLAPKPNSIIILKKGRFKIFNDSYIKTLKNILFEISSWIRDTCLDLMNNETQYLYGASIRGKSICFPKPNNIEFIKFILKIIKNNVIKLFYNLFIIEQWNIGYLNTSIDKLLEENKELKINWIFSPKKNEFFADPFLIKYNNNRFIFFEKFKFEKNKGQILVINFNDKNINKEAKTSLTKIHHMSYPFVFRCCGVIYLIPEEPTANEIALYKAKKFPYTWEKIGVLIDNIQGGDPTLIKFNDLWWLFCTHKGKNGNLKLFLYYSQDLLGKWFPHKNNPVKIDIKSARPAGKIFEYKGNLIRPSQDCSQTYGGSIVLNKINKLTPDEFEEEPIKLIKPNFLDKFNKGIHTINFDDNFIFVDGKRYRVYMKKFRMVIKEKFTSSYFGKNVFSKYSFINIPIYIEKIEYLKSIEQKIELLKKINGIKSIYQIGSLRHPGISDIDIIVIFENEAFTDYNPRKKFSDIDNYLFPHGISAICEYHFKNINKFSFFHELKYLWGKEFKLNLQTSTHSSIDILKKQTAIEYLIDNYIDLTVQLKYKIIKLRNLLQHIKAIRYDLEFLDISSGKFYDLVTQLVKWVDNWFEEPINFDLFCEWIDIFYKEFGNFLKKCLKRYLFYLPEWANLKYSRNIIIEFGKTIDWEFRGIVLPKSLAGFHKKAFNLDTRLNIFKFKIPFNNNKENIILENRFNYYKEIKNYTSKHFPYFSPLISVMAYKIIQ